MILWNVYCFCGSSKSNARKLPNRNLDKPADPLFFSVLCDVFSVLRIACAYWMRSSFNNVLVELH